MYGDRMLWGSFCPASVSETPEFTSPFEGLRVNTAVFAYDRTDLKDVRFIRYEITNEGAAPVTDLRGGYFSDTDSPTSSIEAVGFDQASGLSYAYNLSASPTGRSDWHTEAGRPERAGVSRGGRGRSVAPRLLRCAPAANRARRPQTA